MSRRGRRTGPVVLGDGIRCQDLILHSIDKLVVQNEIVVDRELEIDECQIESQGNQVIHGALSCRSSKLSDFLKNTVVFGDCQLSIGTNVPESFCCLGRLTASEIS